MKNSSMDIKDFKAGVFQPQDGFNSFSPSFINRPWQCADPKINVLVEQASREVGSINAFSDLIPNIDIYIKMHIFTEANKSNKIEGTNTSIQDDLMSVEDVLPEKRDDYQEVQNYIKALNHGIQRITKDNFPLCNRLICEIHKILLQGVRGKHKSPGEMRHSQNWIGGFKPSDAAYVPPTHMELPELMTDFEMFINNDKLDVPDLIKIAILHYQFETIHPFLDGNGRIGRLLIPLYLLNKGILSKPCFYISDYFEKHRLEYYTRLNNVRVNNDLCSWIIFFLQAVINTAESGKEKFTNVMTYVHDTEGDVMQITARTDNSLKVVRAFYDSPILNTKQLVQLTGLSQGTVDNIVRQLLERDILREITGYSRNRIFVLWRYLDIFS